jgi:predicted molibdopterin-dependent oxidoreductase YjgC
VFHVPARPNARAVAEAWAAAADEDEVEHEGIGLLVVSGDEAASDPSVRALAEHADAVIAITMFHSLVVGWADLVLPATAALEREGTAMNVEGRVQRLRRAVMPPVPDELAWLSRLAERFDVELSPHPAVVFEELSERIYGGLELERLGEHAELPARAAYVAPEPARGDSATGDSPPGGQSPHFVGTLRLLRYTPLFSGHHVERVPELQFQRPEREVALSPADADRRGIATGDLVSVRSNGTSVELRARVDRRLVEGVARIAEEHAADLHAAVEIIRGTSLREVPTEGDTA